jgi:quinol monooxygenase YgiN
VQTIVIVLNVRAEQAAEFEAGFREMELPTWEELLGRGLLRMATLTKLDISTREVEGAVQYLIACIFEDGEGHHAHDNHPRFAQWNKRADAFQIAEPFVFGGDTMIEAHRATD